MKTETTRFDAIIGKVDEPVLDANAFYLLDLDKIKKVDDIKAVFNALGFNFVGNHPRINMIAHLLDRNNPIYPPQPLEVEEDLSKLDDIEDKTEENAVRSIKFTLDMGDSKDELTKKMQQVHTDEELYDGGQVM